VFLAQKGCIKSFTRLWLAFFTRFERQSTQLFYNWI